MNRLLTEDYRILSFDPGSRHLGMAVQSLNPSTWQCKVMTAETLHVDKWIETDSFSERLRVIKHFVTTRCALYSPVAIAVELPYMGKRPQAYGSLKETVLTIKTGCEEWLPHAAIFFYEPSVIKKTNGVPGNSGDKELMKKALLSCDNITFSPWVSVAGLDEHSIDAILIGYTHVQLSIRHYEKAVEKKQAAPRGKRN